MNFLNLLNHYQVIYSQKGKNCFQNMQHRTKMLMRNLSNFTKVSVLLEDFTPVTGVKERMP